MEVHVKKRKPLEVCRTDATRLLQPRTETAAQLGCSIATIIRHEKAGRLTPIRPGGTLASAVYHRPEQVRALANGGDDHVA
jgi:hypothetical protein